MILLMSVGSMYLLVGSMGFGVSKIKFFESVNKVGIMFPFNFSEAQAKWSVGGDVLYGRVGFAILRISVDLFRSERTSILPLPSSAFLDFSFLNKLLFKHLSSRRRKVSFVSCSFCFLSNRILF